MFSSNSLINNTTKKRKIQDISSSSRSTINIGSANSAFTPWKTYKNIIKPNAIYPTNNSYKNKKTKNTLP